MSNIATQWNYLNLHEPVSLSELEDILCQNRNLNTLVEKQKFFSPPEPISYLLDEVGLSVVEMSKAKRRLGPARPATEKVLIFGDYDVDGNCATAIMWQALKAFGITATPFIPHRQLHGYGLTDRSLTAILDVPEPPQLIITVDNGIVAHPALKKIAALGIDVILTDHHQPEVNPETQLPLFPPAAAIFHSTQLCGAGVAWFFARELLRECFPNESDFQDFLNSQLDLAALATLVDQVPVLNANRSFIVSGLVQLQRCRRLGLKQLCLSAQLDPKEITTHSVDYILGPRINAIGRIRNNLDALRLLCTTSTSRAQELASSLELTNQERRDLTDNLLNLALAQADDQKDELLIIVSSPDFHEGIIGLIASRLVEKYHRPILVISCGAEIAKGSARSIPGVNITEILRAGREELLEVGGHPLAAGCSLQTVRVSSATRTLQQLAREKITPTQLIPHYDIECTLPAPLLDEDFLSLLRRFSPFGTGNEDFLLVVKNLELIRAEAMGKTGHHQKQFWRDPRSGVSLTTLLWRASDRPDDQLPLPNQFYNLVLAPQVNVWRGKSRLQLILQDFQVVT